MAQRVLAYPGCPTLTWMIANRVCNRMEESDAFITFTGRKGSGKSSASIAFCESLADDISRLRQRGEPPSKFFNVDHIRSISERGAADILTSGILKQKNSIILLDDTGTQWGARNFQTTINKYLNMILQICRVYQGVIVSNFIMKNHIDIQAREMTDFRAEMQYKDVSTGQAFFKFFHIAQNEKGEYKQYLTWHGKRIKLWVIEKPEGEVYKQYRAMRQANTDKFVEEAGLKIAEKYDGVPRVHKQKPAYDYTRDPVIKKYAEAVIQTSQKKVKGRVPGAYVIAAKVGTTPWYVKRILSLHAEGKL